MTEFKAVLFKLAEAACVWFIELCAILEFFLVETTFIVGINLLVAVKTALHAFSLVASLEKSFGLNLLSLPSYHSGNSSLASDFL